MVRSEFMAAVNQICSERGIEPDEVLKTLEHAMLAAYRKDHASADDLTVSIDRETGGVKIMRGDEDVTPPGFGRIAAQTAKQVILQGVREAEKTAIISEYSRRIGSVVSGMIQRRDGQSWIVDIGRATAVMPLEEQVAIEKYQLNQRLKVLIKEIREINNKQEIIVSRVDSDLVKGLFELEVPEVANGSVEIKDIAREPGLRSKIAVESHQVGVDAVGSCVGQRGVRVQAVTNELTGEKLDIILWSDDSTRYIAASLSPAKVLDIVLAQQRKIAKVEVAEEQLSLAIGRDGQNVRLAAKLTGYRIDIKGAGAKEEERTKVALAPELEQLGLSARTKSALTKAGLDKPDKLASLSSEELRQVKGIGPKSLAEITKALKKS